MSMKVVMTATPRRKPFHEDGPQIAEQGVRGDLSRGILTGTLWWHPRPGVLGTYPTRGTRIPGGTGYWRHNIYSGQENFTLWEPEEHHDHRRYTRGGWTCGAQLRGL